MSRVYVRKVSRHEVKKSAWVKRSKVFRYCPLLDISTSQVQFVTHFYLVTQSHEKFRARDQMGMGVFLELHLQSYGVEFKVNPKS